MEKESQSLLCCFVRLILGDLPFEQVGSAFLGAIIVIHMWIS